MRTVLLITAFSIRDIAEALGKAPIDNPNNVLPWFMLVMMVMDVVDFLRGKK